MSSISPIITFKAGRCQLDDSSKPYKVKPEAEPGYIYLYSDDDLLHFCWRPRSKPLNQGTLDLVAVPSDCTFIPYNSKTTNQASADTNGRIFVLKFAGSSVRYLFWLQSKPQGRGGDPSWLSPRDKKLGEIVNRLLQGEEVDVNRELAQVTNNTDDSRRDDDDDETMEDVEGRGDPSEHHEAGTGGAGPDATGGDIRREGEDSREGGADGARAASSATPDAATVVRNLLASLQGQGNLGGGQQSEPRSSPLLNDLLSANITVPVIESASEQVVNTLVQALPDNFVVLFKQTLDIEKGREIQQEEGASTALAGYTLDEKRRLLKRVLRSPQYHQSLITLTMALRDGGLPAVSSGLGIKVENNGYISGGTMPLGGGDAIKAFVEGVKKTVQEEKN